MGFWMYAFHKKIHFCGRSPCLWEGLYLNRIQSSYLSDPQTLYKNQMECLCAELQYSSFADRQMDNPKHKLSWTVNTDKTRMWANAQHDGRPSECRWHPVFNAANFGWHPVRECLAVMLPRRETHWNLLGYPKHANRSQLIVGRSSRYCEDVGETLLFNKFFFPTVNTCLSCEDVAQESCAMVPRRWIFGDFLGPAFPASHVQHISDVHFESALELHHV